jgi:hypothetical protein
MEPVASDFDDLYDEHQLARIDAASGRPAHAEPPSVADEDAIGTEETPEPGRGVIPRYPVARRVGAAVLAGALMGMAEVFEPERARHHIIDYVPDRVDEDEQLVTFEMAPGDPRASRLIVRPWLLDRFRARRA